ncbi:helicase [Desmophyllum pertusum]|uniref:Helicase n=1 Tax=Desmophyllum pertusum TaxID=174260 RepID=A0A9X0CWS1_9CNID|nr:helicase [Desmophyllum pertusum]
MAFLWLRALELQGEVQEAFTHAVIYKVLDPQMTRDKDAVRRLRAKVKSLCGQGKHQIYRTIDILMKQGEKLFKDEETELALSIFTEVVNLLPQGGGNPKVHEYRAQCYFIRGDLTQANHDCNRALNLSDRSSITAFDTKIKIHRRQGELKDLEEALELLDEWRKILPENMDHDPLIELEKQIREQMAEVQSLSDASFDHETDEAGEIQTKQKSKRPQTRASKQSSGAKPKTKKELQREERQREKERQEIAQQLLVTERKREERNNNRMETEADFQIEEEQYATNEESSSRSLPTRSKKKKTRRKTRNKRRANSKGAIKTNCKRRKSKWKNRMTCKFGKGCTFAHGVEELTAWNEHLKRMEKEVGKKSEEEKKKEQNKDGDSAAKSKVSSLIKDRRPVPTYKFKDLVSSLPEVTVTCEPKDPNISLQVPLDSEGEKTYSWTLRLFYESSITGHLQDVVLLWQHPKCYTLSSFRFKCTVGDPINPIMEVGDSKELIDELHYPVTSCLHALQGRCEVEIVVAFSTLVFGSFRQFVVFDFGKETHLAFEMSIEIGSQEFLQEFSEEKTKLALLGPLWDDGSRKIIPFGRAAPSVFNDDYLTVKYKLPRSEDIVPSPLLEGSQGLSKENYIDVMHQLLFVEEFYIRKQVASFNVQGVHLHAAKLVVKKDDFLCAQEGWLYGSFHVSRPITPDNADGKLLLRNLLRSMGSVLIAKTQSPDSVVYEALVDSVEDSRVILKLSVQCCEDLALTDNSDATVDVQFRINRLPLCEMHDNIDRLGPEHIRILFPAFSSVGLEEKVNIIPWILDQKLNEDQKEIITKIAVPSINAPPLVVFGPFGTGKTFTLNQAVRRIALDCNNRVLICTHSNSAADIHVELLDEHLKEQHGIMACTPLRIYTPLRKLSTVSDQVKEYCLITDRGKATEAFRLPTRDDVLRHRVVVSTLGMSRALFDMELHRGFFSHILIDEAAQALETEALTPITLAGNNTKVVFTGDHMQMSPDVFSPQAKKWGFQMSLQERLFYDYKKGQKEKSLDPNLIMLTENYRSNEQVLQFSSDMFYGGELGSGSDQPLHPWLGPLVFYSALGKEEIEENNSSYRNLAEVNEVVKRVKELADYWPEAEWGPKDLKQIAVVSSYRYQVKTIRDGLRKIGLGEIDVETIENVQGKQFRALFVSTIPSSLNTALTRAQSFIAVVGDPFSLRTIGACQGLWEEFIKRCSDKGQLFGIEQYELEESISQSGLNVNASEFVPGVFTNTTHLATVDQQSNHQACDLSEPDHEEEEEGKEEDGKWESVSDSDDAGDELSESDDLGNADDFAEYGNVDETVPPKHMDDIILALKAKCEEKAEKRKLRDKAGLAKEKELMQFIALVTDKEAEEDTTNRSVNSHFDPDTGASKIVHEDYIMTTRKGKTKTFLVNLNWKVKYSERTERLIRQPKSRDQECLQPEYLDRLLKKEPELYRQCTLRISYEKSKTCYGEIQDIESEDILIEGNTRQRFDRDVVVVKLKKGSSNESTALPGNLERMKGEIIGTRHHVINHHERQFVCMISRHNPSVMYPINKSMTSIVNLRDNSCKGLGVPIYKKIQPGSGERAVRVDTLSLREALSGKYLFVVQYLQWRGEFPYPHWHYNQEDSQRLISVKGDFSRRGCRRGRKTQERLVEHPECERVDSQTRNKCTMHLQLILPEVEALDDALTIEKLENGNCRVGVHIADVSTFVKQGSRIDIEARRRGTSYFRGHHNGAQRVIFGKPILNKPARDGQVTVKIKQSICTLSSVAQKRRKVRLSDGSFYHFGYADRKEDLEAHELVEEMMILANTSVARYLVQRKAALSPLRIQLPPKTRKLDEWREKFGDCAKLSLSLRRHLRQDVECVDNFFVPKSTWNVICNATAP